MTFEPIARDALALIGGTPLIRLGRVSPEGGATVVGKLESKNPGGSIKDRPAWSMIRAAEQAGELRPSSVIIEATSGNTGISLAMIAAVRGYRCVLVMPEDMSLERRQILRAYGADIVLTSSKEAMAGAVEQAHRLVRETPNAFMPSQFDNPANVAAHESTTAREILDAVPKTDLVAFVAGVGTGGTITGVGRAMKRERPDVRVVAVEPHASAILSGRKAGAHRIQGIGAGFLPAILDRSAFDEVVTVTDASAERMARRLAREEGLLVGPSSGANVHVAREVASRFASGIVVTVLCDSGERYLF